MIVIINTRQNHLTAISPLVCGDPAADGVRVLPSDLFKAVLDGEEESAKLGRVAVTARDTRHLPAVRHRAILLVHVVVRLR